MSNFCPSNFRRKKYVQRTWIFRLSTLHRKMQVKTMSIFRPEKLHQKKCVETTSIFRPSKLYRKKYVETTWIFRPVKLHQKSTWKQRGFFDYRKITPKQVRGNDVDFWTIEITSKNVRGNNVNFWTIEITSKKCVETMWKSVEIWSSTYRCKAHVESRSIRHGVPIGRKIHVPGTCPRNNSEGLLLNLCSMAHSGKHVSVLYDKIPVFYAIKYPKLTTIIFYLSA